MKTRSIVARAAVVEELGAGVVGTGGMGSSELQRSVSQRHISARMIVSLLLLSGFRWSASTSKQVLPKGPVWSHVAPYCERWSREE